MINYFEIFAEKLAALEEGQKELRSLLTHTPASVIDAEPNGDFTWICSVYPAPSSTIRIKSAAGLIPGTFKVGRRVLYKKATVLAWLCSNPVAPANTTEIKRKAEAQVNAKMAAHRKQAA